MNNTPKPAPVLRMVRREPHAGSPAVMRMPAAPALLAHGQSHLRPRMAGRDTCTGACETAIGCQCVAPPVDLEFNRLLHRIQWLRGCEGHCGQARGDCVCHDRAMRRRAPNAVSSVASRAASRAARQRRPDTGPDTLPLIEAPSAYRRSAADRREADRRAPWARRRVVQWRDGYSAATALSVVALVVVGLLLLVKG